MSSASASSATTPAASAAKASAAKAVDVTEKKNVLADAFESHEGRDVKDPKKRKLSAVEQIRLEHEEAKRP
eukprot:g24209.t1